MRRGSRGLRGAVLAASLLQAAAANAALGRADVVTGAPSRGAVVLAQGERRATLYLDPDDWPGVLRAARDLRADLGRVTGRPPALETAAAPRGSDVIIAGTLGRSRLIDGLVASRRIDTTGVAGRWEAYLIQAVKSPLPGVERALVVAGADKRGTIYGLYELSEEIGVSPWYFWADVPPRQRDALFVPAGARVQDAPVVRYRGIFINDEAPALTGWAQQKFGGFNHRMYAKVFELLLRLRANYLWPAMWLPRAFADDDPENARLADEFGIVMGTSHHEPMMRAHDEWNRYGKGPWSYAANDAVLREFWRSGVERVKDYEKVVTLGMRGDGDEAMSEETNVALLERIVADQRRVLGEAIGRPLAEIPQVWALYKEVQGYYERGMRVPDDVTLLWCDDNWGNLRRLPTPEERRRPGGAGIYYHFDYVGGPRSYKWMNVTPLSKIWEQMHLAWRYGADRLWIVNVGDLKPMELPIDFFLSYAWSPERWPYERVGEYSRAWAAREFGPEHAVEIARLASGYAKLNRQRTPELLEPDTYSLVHYREAERHLEQWRGLVAGVERLESALGPQFQDALFQLVSYPVRASAVARELNVAAGLNRLYGLQGRAAGTTAMAARVRALYAEDRKLVDRYHALGGGKWNHMMAQIKYGYTYWQVPPIEVLPAVSEARPNPGAEPGLAIEGDPHGRPRWGTPAPVLPSIDRIRRTPRFVELFNRGDAPFTFEAKAEPSWLRVTPGAGRVEDQVRLSVGADWSAVPAEVTEAFVNIDTSANERFRVRVPIAPTKAAAGAPAGTFVEVDGHVAIDAPHYARAVNDGGVVWKTLPDFGPGAGGVTPFPVLAAERQPGGGSPRLEYDLQFTAPREVSVEFHFAPSLDFQPGEGLRFAWSLGEEAPRVAKLGTWQTQQTWDKAVSDSIRRVTVKANAAAGHQVLKYWYVTPGVVLERVVIDAGGLRPSYLGPPESPRLP